MIIAQIDIIQYKVVLVKLSCGVSFSLKVDIDYENLSEEAMATNLTKIIQKVSYYEEDYVFYVYENY